MQPTMHTCSAGCSEKDEFMQPTMHICLTGGSGKGECSVEWNGLSENHRRGPRDLMSEARPRSQASKYGVAGSRSRVTEVFGHFAHPT